jgi:superfamily II DNA or RNA helicase
MKDNLFQTLVPSVTENGALREPQIEAFEAIQAHDFSDGQREVGVVLPVGCGKSGLLALAPFAVASKRTLLVAPNLNIADQLLRDLTPSDTKHFYSQRVVLAAPPYPEAAEIRGTSSNLSDLEEADIVITNIQQLQREDNRWLTQFPEDFFDLIEFDEAHHNVAESWQTLRTKFPAAKIVNVSATPTRADGQLMDGDIIYSYPISKAVSKGYVKRVTGYRLAPQTLKYVRREGDAEIEVSLDEVRRLGEVDANFRRSIVSSEETLSTIAEASIRKLQQLRDRSGDARLKIIASALNMEHCKQVVAKYRELDMRADFVHSNLGKANDAVYRKLENHELDVIVQVRKLGEGFDHPHLTVAAVFSIFSNLGPFMQFVGRIMRVIPGVDPFDTVNDGVVVFHVGGNITGVWNDFRQFADADQGFFANLIDEDLVEDSGVQAREGSAREGGTTPLPIVTEQATILVEDLSLLSVDPEVARAITLLRDRGLETPEQIAELIRITPTKQASRQAKRTLLDEQVKVRTGRLLAQHNLQHAGKDLDKAYLGNENFKVIKSAIDRQISAAVPSGAKKRADYTASDLDQLISNLPDLVLLAEAEVFNG